MHRGKDSSGNAASEANDRRNWKTCEYDASFHQLMLKSFLLTAKHDITSLR